MDLLPGLIKLEIKTLTDLEIPLQPPKSLFKTHFHLNIDENLAETIELSFDGTSAELKWKVIELVKVPIEEILYAYSAKNQKLYLLNKKLWVEKIEKIKKQTLQLEKVTVQEQPVFGLEIDEPALNYAQIKKGLKTLSLLGLCLSLLWLGLNLFFKNPDYAALGGLKETSQNLKNTLNQILETEKEFVFQKEKNLLHKQWLKIFKNFSLQLPATVKLSEINMDETGNLLQLKGEAKNQTLLQNWAKQIPNFEMTQIQMQTSPNNGYLFTAHIHAQRPQ